MSAYYQASVSEFLVADEHSIVGRLSTIASQALTEISSEQLEAWRQQIRILGFALRPHATQSWHVLFEFPIPRRGKRIDAVILAGHLILVVEFKCGARKYSREAIVQVEDYCLDLRDFHEASRQQILIPILVATHAEERAAPGREVIDSVTSVWFANAGSFERVIEQVVTNYSSLGTDSIDAHRWNAAAYAPTPTIVEAARVLYEGKNVQEITRCHAGAENLTKTSLAVVQAIEEARRQGRKLMCFVTGVPGSGKTLAGLNVVHNRDLHLGSLGVFLSGNGPLVKVLSEALARDHSARTKEPIAESRRRVSTFIQNVHRFIDAHLGSAIAPPDRVVVFDEAQRAWNREQSLRKFKRDSSEPETMLDIMDRHRGWAVIVALVGNGQEINTGEAGLSEWGRALANRFQHWDVLVSPHAIHAGILGQADLLFDSKQHNEIRVSENLALHLEVSLRSYKAQAVSDFVANLLNQQIDSARSVLTDCPNFPMVMTRDFQKAREWLRSRQRGSRRIGLIASSGGRRLRAHGLDVRPELEVENWFLNPSSDVRSSFYLETPATEFGVQGLELDWTGVCWDLDLVPERDGWKVQAFKGSKWQNVRDAVRYQYVLNKYRVLLTRAREGMIIWVPVGDSADRTRPKSSYEAIAAYLNSCGIAEI